MAIQFPKIRKKISAFIREEEGKITKEALFKMGVIIGSAAIISAASAKKVEPYYIQLSQADAGQVIVVDSSHYHHSSSGGGGCGSGQSSCGADERCRRAEGCVGPEAPEGCAGGQSCGSTEGGGPCYEHCNDKGGCCTVGDDR